jgi:hypothetical protein
MMMKGLNSLLLSVTCGDMNRRSVTMFNCRSYVRKLRQEGRNVEMVLRNASKNISSSRVYVNIMSRDDYKRGFDW